MSDALDQAAIQLDEAAAVLEAAAKELRAEAHWIRNDCEVEARAEYAKASVATQRGGVSLSARKVDQLLTATD